jgi:hypothetical protein
MYAIWDAENACFFKILNLKSYLKNLQSKSTDISHL